MPRKAFQGKRLEFLVAEQSAYAKAVVDGTKDDFLLDVCRRFFKRFKPERPANEEPTEDYMIETLKQVLQQFKGVPDLACQMLIKICKMILACIEDFHESIHMRATWARFLEGRQGH